MDTDRMYSCMAVAFPNLDSHLLFPVGIEPNERVIPTPTLSMLPDGGLPRGAVVEFASIHCLGQSTSLALHACASAQRETTLRSGQPAWCAWLDPAQTLYAPGIASQGVSLDHLLVVHPPPNSLARIAVRMTTSRLFPVLVVDTHGVPGSNIHVPLERWNHVVRRLAIAARESDTCVVLLTALHHARFQLPVALRLELERPKEGLLRVKVAKERRGRVGMPVDLPLGNSFPLMPRSA